MGVVGAGLGAGGQGLGNLLLAGLASVAVPCCVAREPREGARESDPCRGAPRPLPPLCAVELELGAPCPLPAPSARPSKERRARKDSERAVPRLP